MYVPKKCPDRKGLSKEKAKERALAIIESEVEVYDQYLTGDVWYVRVEDPDGEVVDSGTPFLGAALGHRVRIGSGITVAAGRTIENETTLVSDDVVRRTPGAGAWAWRGADAPWRPL